jgi:glycosyltransferase involved in cell wall biosynthesis
LTEAANYLNSAFAGKDVRAVKRDLLADMSATRDEMNRFYDAASFYLCTSYAEGQNLPLIEAMARGVVPITVDHTAMADYISDNDAVVIPSHTRPLDIRLTARYRMYGVDTNYVDAADVHSALLAARDIPDSDYAHKSAASWEEVRSQFGTEVVANQLRTLVERLKVGGAA